MMLHYILTKGLFLCIFLQKYARRSGFPRSYKLQSLDYVSVEMVNPWQLCRTIGPLLSQRSPLASAQAQPRGGGFRISLFPLEKCPKFLLAYHQFYLSWTGGQSVISIRVHWHIHLFVCSLVRSSVRSFVRSFMHSFIHSFNAGLGGEGSTAHAEGSGRYTSQPQDSVHQLKSYGTQPFVPSGAGAPPTQNTQHSSTQKPSTSAPTSQVRFHIQFYWQFMFTVYKLQTTCLPLVFKHADDYVTNGQ